MCVSMHVHAHVKEIILVGCRVEASICAPRTLAIVSKSLCCLAVITMNSVYCESDGRMLFFYLKGKDVCVSVSSGQVQKT